MTGYTNANRDDRGVLDRYLPTPYRKIGSGTEVHNAFLGAIKNSIISTEKDLIDNVKQVYISNATGKLLDFYGKWIGLSRDDSEEDDDYRNRLLSLIVTERVTVKGIIAGIKADLKDPSMDVSIYEPWRNIFILNQSLLNGPDHLMGTFYRYAVIQVTLSKYVPQEVLNRVLKNYKAAGVQVYFVLSSGMTYTGDVLSVPINLSYQGRSQTSSEKVLSNYSFGINDLPVGALNKGIFTTNISKLNSSDVLAGSPENTYAYQYGTAPSKNIFGLVDKGAIPESYTDPYDYVYQGTKVDLSIVGGRNLLLGSRYYNGDQWLNIQSISDTYKGVSIVSASNNGTILNYDKSGLVSDNKINTSDTYVLSMYVKNTSSAEITITFSGGSTNQNESIVSKVGSESDWVMISKEISFWTTGGNPLIGIGLQGIVDNSVLISCIKLETGTMPTDWTPAPEDTPKTYIYPYKNSSYVNMGRKDGVVETLTNSSKQLVFALNVKEYLLNIPEDATEGIISLPNFNQSSVSRIILKTYGSPYGIASTTLVARKKSDNTIVTGKWYHYDDNTIGTLIGNTLPKSSTSSLSYAYVLDTPAELGSLEFSDYYPKIGANRTISLSNGVHTACILSTEEQTTGTIYVPSLSNITAQLVEAYTKRIYSDIISNSDNFDVYDYNTSKWVPIDEGTNLVPYLHYGNITSGVYILIGTSSEDVNIDYIGLNITLYETGGIKKDNEIATIDVSKVDYSKVK